jgi:hypothetical protein
MNTDAVFFDREGSIYPDYFIADSSLLNASAKVHNWYIAHPIDFEKISTFYNCTEKTPSQVGIEELDAAILKKKVGQIDQMKTQENKLTILIHGFRKSFVKSGDDNTSTTDFDFLEAQLRLNGQQNIPVLKVYWDGLYDCCFSLNAKKNDQLFALFETSYNIAENVGFGLRKLLNQLDFNQLNILGHSLAAKVIQASLYGTEKCSATCLQQSKVNVCLIAPATSGIESWRNYYERNFLVGEKDNVRILVLYNEKDFALLKKDNKIELLGPGAKKYGSTELGCNKHKSAEKLKTYFTENYPKSTFELVNCTKLGKVHSQRFYINSVYFQDVIKFIE